MSQLADTPQDTIPVTRALRRSRGRWRIFAFIALAIAVIAAAFRFAPDFGPVGEHVARVEISGTITTDYERLEMLRELGEDDSIKAVIVAINSPGGTTAGGEELYEALRTLSQTKPTVAVIDEMGASAAYMTAIGTDHILARRLSIIGSIGVLYRHVDAGRLLDSIGIDLDKIATGPLKAEPEFDGPIAPPVRENLETLVGDSFDWFVDIVAERRGLDRSGVLALADGRIMTGSRGVETGLIDANGGIEEARAWLAETHGIAADIDVETVWPPSGGGGWLGRLVGEATQNAIAGWSPAVALDGLVSLWHPSGDGLTLPR